MFYLNLFILSSEVVALIIISGCDAETAAKNQKGLSMNNRPRSSKRGLQAARVGRQTLRSAPVARGASWPVLGKRDRKALARSVDHGW